MRGHEEKQGSEKLWVVFTRLSLTITAINVS